MKTLFFLIMLLFGSLFAFFTSIQNGSFVRFLDKHPNPEYTPRITNALGHGYYLLGDLEDAATYYLRVADRFPKSPLAEPAYFSYLDALDENRTPREDMATLYETYLTRFPEGPHAEMVKKRIYLCRTR